MFPGGQGRYPQYTTESLLALDPDVVIDAAYYDTPTPRQLKDIRAFWARLKSLKAVKEKKVFIVKTDIHSVPGPRTPLLLGVLAQVVHPDLFGDENVFSVNIFEN